MRKHATWYIKGLSKSTEIKDKINRMESTLDVIKVLNEYKNSLD